MATKICRMCGLELDVSMFYMAGGGYVNSYCKPCHNAISKKWAKTHSEIRNEVNRRYRKKNAEKVKLWARADREKHKDRQPVNLPETKVCTKCKIEKDIDNFPFYGGYLQSHCYACRAEQKRLWSKRNPDWQLNYRRANPDRTIAYVYARLGKVKQLPGQFTDLEWANLKSKYEHTCLSCGRQEPEILLTVDHVIPVGMPGSRNDIANIQPLCLACNARKNNRIIDFRTLERLTATC